MKVKKGLNSKSKGVIDYDGWHIAVLGDHIVEVIPNDESRIDLLTKVLFCERYAKQRQSYLRFKLFLSRDLGRLESILRVQGYKRNQGQVLMYLEDMALPLTRRGEIEIKIYDKNHEEFSERRHNLLSEEIAYGHDECICELVVNKIPVGVGLQPLSRDIWVYLIYISLRSIGVMGTENICSEHFFIGGDKIMLKQLI